MNTVFIEIAAGRSTRKDSHPKPKQEIRALAGQRISVIGRCDSGKTAVCLALVGQPRPVAPLVHVSVDGSPITSMSERSLAQRTALVPSNVRSLFSGIFSTVEDELHMSLSLLGKKDDPGASAVGEFIALLGLSHLVARNPMSLSGGEKVRVGVALQLIKQPELIVLDQVFDQLDIASRYQLASILQACARNGAIVVETHASASTLAGHFDQNVLLKETIDLPARCSNDETQPSSISHPAISTPVILRCKSIAHAYPATGFVLGPISLDVQAGSCIAVIGPNGSGKTTLLKALGGLIEARYEQCSIQSASCFQELAELKRRRRHKWAIFVQYAFQDPSDQLFMGTAQAELEENARRTGLPTAVVRDRVSQVANSLGIDKYLSSNPLSLPRAIQRLVMLGAILVASPPVVLLDEPTADLDSSQKCDLAAALRAFMQNGGACIMISHDDEFVSKLANQRLRMEAGVLVSPTN